jgi:hypothetical protein
MKNKLVLLSILAVIVGLGIGLFVIYERQCRVLCDVVWEAPHAGIKTGANTFGFHRPRQAYCMALTHNTTMPDYFCERVHAADGSDVLKITWKSTTSLAAGISNLTFSRGLTPGAHYALIGAIRREDINSGCRMEMTSVAFSGTRIKKGYDANETFFEVERNADWQPFALRVDESKMDFSLASFSLNLQLNGPNTVELRDLKFVQYPNGTNPLDAHGSFMRGQLNDSVIAEVALLLLTIGITGFIAIYRQQRHEREMRRIASLDS